MNEGEHLDAARDCAYEAYEHRAVRELERAAVERGTLHALIDIAESLRTLAAPKGEVVFASTPPAVPPLGEPRTINLAEYALEHAGGVGDE